MSFRLIKISLITISATAFCCLALSFGTQCCDFKGCYPTVSYHNNVKVNVQQNVELLFLTGTEAFSIVTSSPLPLHPVKSRLHINALISTDSGINILLQRIEKQTFIKPLISLT